MKKKIQKNSTPPQKNSIHLKIQYMKKMFFCILLMHTTLCLQSQENQPSSRLELPSVAPVSPEAASLGKYGDLPVNLASGKINYSIPIFTIQEIGFEVPIYLSYNHSGLLTEEDPGMAGLGWTLHSGGMITRQMRGKSDENDGGYVGGNIGKDYVIPLIDSGFYQMSPNDRLNYLSQNESFWNNFLNKASQNKWDTQPDKFSINTGNLSGNFYYNEEGDFILRPHKNYNITSYNEGFKVLDDNGITYDFTQKEETQTEALGNNEELLHAMTYTSAWALTKISSSISDNVVEFEYNSHSNPYTKEGITKSYRKILAQSSSSDNPNLFCSNNVVNTSYNETTVLNRQLISKIKFSKGEIHFDIRQTPNNSESNSGIYLYGIDLYDNLGNKITSYTFHYDDLYSNFRLLEEVKITTNESYERTAYQLEYNDKPPRSLLTQHQDSWGYYSTSFDLDMLGRRKVNFTDAKKGALKKITYPTGGYTEIEYEPNSVHRLPYEFLASGQEFTTPINKQLQVIATKSNPNPLDKTLLITTDQVIKVHVEADASSGNYVEAEATIERMSGVPEDFECVDNGLQQNCSTYVTAHLENGGDVDGNYGETDPNINDNQNSEQSNSDTNYFFVKANTTLKLSASLITSTNGYGSAQVIVDYFDPNDISIDSNGYAIDDHVNIGGIRIASVKDCTDSDNCISKDYKYVDSNGKISGKLLSNPIYHNDIYTSNPDGGSGGCYYRVFSSNSKLPFASFQGSPVLYSRVEVLQNGSNNNGKTVQLFTYQQNPIAKDPFPPLETQDWKKGLPSKQFIFNNTNDTLKKVENNYITAFPSFNNPLKRSKGLVVSRFALTGTNSSIGQFISSDFENTPEFYQKISSFSSDYLNGIKLTSISTTSYDSLTGYPIKQETTNSQGEVLKSVSTYPTSGRLFDENRISQPIKVSTYKQEGSNPQEQLSEQLTVYSDFLGNYLPEKILTSKGSQDLENRIIYHKYDNKSNPIEVSKKDGTHIVYLWGYNKTQPIAKIEGATYAEVESAAQAISNTTYNSIAEIQILSNLDIDEATEAHLRLALNDLRDSFAGTSVQVTTFTYDPMIGVTSITDPRGETIYYTYDSFNRLQFVKDADGNMLSKNEYNYKN